MTYCDFYFFLFFVFFFLFFFFFFFNLEIELYFDLIYMYVCKVYSWRFEPQLLPYTPQNIYICGVIIVEDKFFTPHDFISLATRATSTLSWILGKSILKPKRVHIHKMTPKAMVQNSWWYNLIKAHGSSSSSYFWLMIQAYEPHRGNLRVVVWRAKKYV